MKLKAFTKIGKVIKAHRTGISTVIGVISIGSGFVLGCKAAVKSHEIIKNGNEAINDAKKAAEENPENQTIQENLEPTIKEIRKGVIIGVGKEFLAPVVLVVGGTGTLCNRIIKLHKQNIVTANALTGLAAAFNQYRQNVIAKYGADVDQEMRFGKSDEEVIEEKRPDGTVVKKLVKTNATPDDLYTYRFDSHCGMWHRNAPLETQMLTLWQAEESSNMDLRLDHVITIKDCLRKVGIKPNSVATVAGWVDDSTLDEYRRLKQVRFGIDWKNWEKSVRTDPVTGEPYFLLDMQVDGAVVDWYDIPKENVIFRRFRGGMKNWLIRSKMRSDIALTPEELEVYAKEDPQTREADNEH